MTTTPLDDYMEQRVFGVRDLKILPLHDLTDTDMPPAVVVQHAGLDIVLIFSMSETGLEVDVTTWVDGKQASAEDAGPEITIRVQRLTTT